MRISIGCDHGALALKNKMVAHLTKKGYDVKDCGTYTADSCDYPDYAHALANGMKNGEVAQGIAICGSGEGISAHAVCIIEKQNNT